MPLIDQITPNTIREVNCVIWFLKNFYKKIDFKVGQF